MGDVVSIQSAPTFNLGDEWGFSEASYGFRASKVMSSDRYRMLERREAYFKCRQHDHKRYDFDGRNVGMQNGMPGPYNLLQPLMGNTAAPFYVPLMDRRPSAPLRLGKQVVKEFTKLTLGEDRWPEIICREDRDTQEFEKGVAEAADLPTRFIQARDKAGSAGAVGLSWWLRDGVPVVEVHSIKTCHVHEWLDVGRWVPKHVTKVYQYTRSVWDSSRNAVVQKKFWYRRDWTTIADVFYEDVEVKAESIEPVWIVDRERSVKHNDGFCHFYWYQNLPDSDDPDSEPDYEGVYEKMDELDAVNSVICRGARLNLDPTLKLKMDPEFVGNAMVRKGSEHALITGQTGDAAYLELSGTSLMAGNTLVVRLKREVLDECECVVVDPDKIAAGSVASVAIMMIYAPMMSKRGLMCTQIGNAIKAILEQILTVCRKRESEIVVSSEDAEGVQEEKRIHYYLALPPLVKETPELDAEGAETGDMLIEFSERVPGAGKSIELRWGPPFKPNSLDVQNTVVAMSTAVGGKAVISVKTACEVVAGVLGKDPVKVLEEMQVDDEKAATQQAGMFGMPGPGDTQTASEAAGNPAAPDPNAELNAGAQEEMEHTDDPEVAKQIAQDHLNEDPAYYRKLKQAGLGRKGPGGALQGPKGLPVPAVEQTPGYCGPAALRAVLAFYGVAVSEARLAELSGATRDMGTQPEGLVEAAGALGYRAEVVQNATIEDLKEAVVGGTPVIVEWFSEDEGHYSVVVGVKGNTVRLMDPELGRDRTMELDAFERVWFDFTGDTAQHSGLVQHRMVLVYGREAAE